MESEEQYSYDPGRIFKYGYIWMPILLLCCNKYRSDNDNYPREYYKNINPQGL